MAKLKKIEEKKAKDEQAKDDLKAALISCLSEMSNDESPTKKRKTVTIAETDTGMATVLGTTLQDILRRVKNK